MPAVHVNDTMKNNKVSNLEVVSPKLAYNSFAKPSVGLTRKRSQSSTGSGRFYRKRKKTWIGQKFFKRECFKFIERKSQAAGSNANDLVCECGLPRSKHTNAKGSTHVQDSSTKWNPDTCTRRVPTDTYGELEFSEDTTTRKPYIRVSHDTNEKLILRLMRERWGLKIPNLAISVTGGAKSFALRPRLKEVFSKGLIKVAVSTGAWIITGGTNAGVMKHVGEAVKRRALVGHGREKINVIGIASWGVIDKPEKLISENGQGLYPAYYSMDATDKSKALLDGNHSHFILVDNGTVGKYGVEIELRSRVEGAILQMKTESNTTAGAIGIPVVILCLEGGPNTIKTMAEAIKKGVPAVVIDGSGRAADVVAFAYRHLISDRQKQIHVIDPGYVEETKSKVAEVFGGKDKEKIYKEICEMLKDDKMVTVYRLDDERGIQDMDYFILQALLKANRASFSSQLNLSLAWNRIDVAKSEIFNEEAKFKTEDLREAMITALIDNKPDFVQLFLNEGLSLRQFLTLDVLLDLYAGLPRNAPVVQMFRVHMAKSGMKGAKGARDRLDMYIVGSVIEDLMGDRFKSRYKTDEIYFGCATCLVNSSVINLKAHEPSKEGNKELPTPWIDLFTWAVLANRRELARLIWERCRENLALALMASKLLKGLVEKALSERDFQDIGVDMLDHADAFEKVALGVLDECRKQDDDDAQTLVIKELPNFGHLTSLDIAVSAEDQDFISHPTCQSLLSRLWMGALSINTPSWQVILCFFLFPLIPLIIAFHGDEERKFEEESDVVEKGDCQAPNDENDCSMVCDEERAIGSHHSLQDSEDGEHVELDEYVPHRKTFNLITDIENQEDAIEVTMRRSRLSYLGKIGVFYQAPFVKFFANLLSYIVFLCLYSFILLTAFDREPHIAEYVLQFWVLTLIFEEFRQLMSQEPKHLWGKLSWYFADPWNIADMLSLFSFGAAAGLRYISWYQLDRNPKLSRDTMTAARIILATDVIIFIIRILQIFSVNKNLGPKLVMIRKMLTDLKYFIFILAIFILGYGVATQAVRFPNTKIGKALVGVFNIPYWQMYGELFIDNILEDPKNCYTGNLSCGPGHENPCSTDYGKWVTPIYMALYMLFTNILLLNLLIAIFNYTFEKVQEDSDKVWKFQRYDLILEYHDRPSLCPPLIIISHFYLVIRWMMQKCNCCGCKPLMGSHIKMKLSDNEAEMLSLWEFNAAEAFTYHSMKVESETLDERVKAIQEKFESVSEEMHASGDGEHGSNDKSGRPDTSASRRVSASRQSTSIDGRIARLEYHMEQILELLMQQNQKQAAILEASKNLTQSQEISTLPKSSITTIHMKARASPYPGSTVARAKVPDDMVPWTVFFSEYMPVIYTSPVVLAGPVWADPDLMEMEPRPRIAFNTYDDEHKTDRRSMCGDYEVIDCLPRNPMGRTGIVGRGLLGKWGPNHAADPIATRWKRTSSGIMLDKGKRVLEFVAVQRRDNHQWAIPGGMVEAGQVISQTLKREFSEEALAKLDMSEEKRKEIATKIDLLFHNGVEVYKGYVDDPRNTDNAWMETVAYNFHDDTGDVFGELELKAGDDAEAVRWQRVSGNIPLFASHVGILEKVAKMHHAAFY